MDYATANDQFKEEPPAWNGIWTGTRPVEWAVDMIDGQKRAFFCSVDYQALADGSFNHIWEAFQPDRTDSYDILDASNTVTTVQNPIFCSFESKIYGDGLDYKRFRYAEFDLIEIGGTVNVRGSFGGNKGTFHEILRKQIIATLTAGDSTNDDVQELGRRLGSFRVQSRRLKSQDAAFLYPNEESVESQFSPDRDKGFNILLQWCGRMGIEAFRMYYEAIPWEVKGAVEAEETGYNILTEDGVSFHFDQ
jgi:hypothetical protein